MNCELRITNDKGLPSGLVPSCILVPLEMSQVGICDVAYVIILVNVHGDAATLVGVIYGGVVTILGCPFTTFCLSQRNSVTKIVCPLVVVFKG